MIHINFSDNKRSLIEKIGFPKRRDASGKTGVIGAHNNDQWLQERINSEAENNLGEIQSSEFIEMIEKREKNSHNFQIHLGKFSSENCAVEHCDDKYDAGNVNNVDMARDLTGKITGCNVEEAANDDTDEYVIMLSENSFLADNQRTDGRSRPARGSGTNYGRIENTDEEAEPSATCINTGNFFREDVELQQDDEGSSSSEDDRGSVLTTKPAHTSQDPIEMRDNSSSHADDDSKRNSARDDDGDTERDDIARNDDGEKTSDCDDDKSEKSHTKTLETNESTTFNDQEQRVSSLGMTDYLIPLKVMVKQLSENINNFICLLLSLFCITAALRRGLIPKLW